MMPTTPDKAGLRHQNQSVWLLVFTAIAVTGMLVGLRCFADYRREVRLLEERLIAQARVVDENLNANLATICLTLENIKEELHKNPSVHAAQINAYLKMQNELIPGIRTLLITDNQGRCRYSNRDPLIGQDLSKRDYFATPRDASDKNQTFISPPFKTLLGTFVINITKPIMGNQGEFKGVISISLDPEYFTTLLKSTIYAPDNRIALLHSDGTVFTAMPDSSSSIIGRNLMNQRSLFFHHIQGVRATSIQTGLSETTGDNRVFAYITNNPKELRFDKHLVVAASRNINEVLLPWKLATGIQLALYAIISSSIFLVTKKMLQRSAELARLHDTQASILAAAGEGILGLDNSGTILFCNQAAEHLTGRNSHELVGRNFKTIVHHNGSGHDIADCPIQLTLKDGVSRTINDCLLVHQETSSFPAEYTVSPLREQNRITGAVIVFRDVTEKRNAESERARNAEYNRALLDSIRSHIAILDKDGVVVSVNDAWMNFAVKNRFKNGEHPRRTGLGTNYLDICRECGDKQALDALEGISSILTGAAQSFTCEYPCHSEDSQSWFLMNVVPLRTEEGGAVVNHINITKRKQMEQALQQSEKRLQRMFRFHGAVMLLIDSENGAIIDANLSAERFYGYPRETLLAMNIADINILPREEIRSEMEHSLKHHRNHFIFEHKLANHSTRTVEVYSSPITMQDKDLLFSIIHDVTDRKLAEEAFRNMEHQLLRSQKLESLARMSGGIAHDFNNLLQGVLGNLELSLMKLPPEDPIRKNIGEGIKSASRAAALSKMMLTYSGKGFLSRKELNLSWLLKESADMLSAVVTSPVTLEIQLEYALPCVNADPDQIMQVITNLVTNAVEAIGEDSGKITLSTGIRHFDQATLNTSRFDEKLVEGQYVWLEVRDTGCGMDGATAYKLFDPFFTTKFTGRGLGMSIAYGIIRAHRGAFLVESTPGCGAKIQFLLPIADQYLQDQKDNSDATGLIPSRIQCAGTIMVVDDEEMIRSVSAAMLRELGFETIEAADGEEALRLFRDQGDRIDLVLLDKCMPQMDGLVVLKELRQIRNGIKVLLATGYSERDVTEQCIGLELNGFIQKPFTLIRLSDEVTRVLRA